MKLKVLKPFKDKLNLKKTYKAGDTLVTEDLVRINDLVARGFCEIVSVDDVVKLEPPVVVCFNEKEYPMPDIKAALVSLGIEVATNATAKGVAKILAALTEEQANALMKALSGEEAPKESEKESDKEEA